MPNPTARPALVYPLGEQTPETGQVIEVAAGIYWLRMGLPFALDHINLWLLRDRQPDPQRHGHWQEGWTVVDCGVDDTASRQAWQQIEAHALQGLPVLRVIVTHMHPDHMGLAHWLCARWQAPLWMGLAEYQAARLACLRPSGLGSDAALHLFAQHGWSRPQDIAMLQRHMGTYAEMVPEVPATHVRLFDGMALHIGERTWQCISGLGHSPEHMALWCAQDALFISGDMLLPGISTNISVYHQEPEANPLAWFLQSLAQMQARLPDTAWVLPSHGRPFQGVHTRVAQLQAHHTERLDELLQACTSRPMNAHEALPLLFKRPLNPQQMAFAMGEAVAHLHALWHAGQVRRQVGPDGVFRFHASS